GDHRRPDREPFPNGPARALGRVSLLGRLDAHDAVDRSRGVTRGLRPHRARKGRARERRRYAACAAERAPARRHRDQPRVRVPHRRSRGHRAGLQPERHRQAPRRRRRAPRLHAHPSAGAAPRVRVRAHQFRGRHGLRGAGPKDPLLVTELARPVARDADDVAKRRYLESTGPRRFVRFWREFIRRRPLGTAGAALIILMLLTAAYSGGRVDHLVQRLMDVLLSFPLIVIAIAVVAALGTGEDKIANVIAAITVPIIPRVARVVRSSALSIVNMPYIEATRAAGSGA